MATIEVKVPDIGNFKGVPVIEVMVKVGDVVSKDQSLVTLESDKATMEVPSNAAGTIRELRVSRQSERQGRLIDADETASMERKKREGYF